MEDPTVDLELGAPGAPASEEKPTVEELQEKLAAETARREAAEQERERWQTAATTRPAEKQPEKKEEVPDVDELSEADLVDIVSGNDKSKFSKIIQSQVKAALKAEGVTTKKDVEELVSSRVQASTQQSQQLTELVQQFPDLQDEQSDLRQEAQRQLETINKDNAYEGLSDFGRIKLAAQLASAKLSGGSDKQERARVARIGAQQGSTSTRNSRRSDESTELSEDEKLAAKVMGISEDDYKKNKPQVKMFR